MRPRLLAVAALLALAVTAAPAAAKPLAAKRIHAFSSCQSLVDYATRHVPPPMPRVIVPGPVAVPDMPSAAPQPAAKPVNPPRTDAIPTADGNETVSVSMQTSQGPIGLTLDNAHAPCTVNSFVNLATQGFFDNTECHRMTTADSLKVLQCGDPTGTGTGGPGYQFANEYPTDQYADDDPGVQVPVPYARGVIAMANAGPDTNGSQFFLVYGDSQLPPMYTIFGTVDEAGLATLDAVAAAGVEGGGQDGKPAQPVQITSVQLD